MAAMNSALAPVVVSVSTSPGGIPKYNLEVAEVTVEGLVGDGHDHAKHCSPDQAVCLFDEEDLNDLVAEGYDVSPGAIGENVLVRGLEIDGLEIGDRLLFSGGVEIELTKRRQPCFVLDSISPELKHVLRDRCGYYAKVVTEGSMRPGEVIAVHRLANHDA
jgi:MOSC domain-containing protein YiiM